MSTCYFCDKPVEKTEDPSQNLFRFSGCLCGKYLINTEVLEDKEYHKILTSSQKKRLFSGYLRNNQIVKIDRDFESNKLEDIIEYCENITLQEKIQKVREYFYNKTSFIGEGIPHKSKELYILFYFIEPSEMDHVLHYLSESEFLYWTNSSIRLSVKGFNDIETARKSGENSKKAFIACKFDTPFMKSLVATIKSACERCGFEASLVSDKKHNKNISNKIISDIKSSKFIVADFTDQNNGVYFEAGYGMGQGKEVIRLIRKGDIESLHFDTKQFNHIEWENDKWEELESDIIDQIKSTIIK